MLITLLVMLAVFTLFAALADHEDAIKKFLQCGMKLLATMLSLT